MAFVTERIFSRLQADGTVSGLVGTRVYPVGSVPQAQTYPFCVMTVITGLKSMHLGGWSGTENARVQVDCIGGSSAQVRQLAFAVTEAMVDSNVGFAVAATDSTDVDTGIEGEFRILLDFSVWHKLR